MTKMLEENMSILTPDDIIFEFEGFLEDHEENLPDGLDAQYMAYVPILEAPFKSFSNFKSIPSALVNLPINAVLHQSWNSIFALFLLITILATPTFGYLIYVSSIVNRTGTGVSFVIIILLGIFASFSYMKYIYGSLNTLMDSRKAPWLVEKIRKQFKNNYQMPWNRRLFYFSLILPLFLDISLFLVALAELDARGALTSSFYIISIPTLILGHLGISIMIFISILSFQYIQTNTRIYDQVLQTIIDRVKGYTDGHESILNKKNYEVVGVLSDTPGLSIRSLGDIPVFGLGSGIFSVNALIFLLISPLLLWTPISGILATPQNQFDREGLSRVILLGVAISSIASFGAVIGPLIRITRVMGNFKVKALTELDPFIFDEITGVALRKDTEISNETQVLFMIRNYIYSMKTSPVNPFRLIQIIALALLYGFRGLPLIIFLFTTIGGLF